MPVKSTATAQTPAFSLRDDPAFLHLDAINVAGPEPTSVALVGAALAAAGLARRRAKVS